MKSAFIAALQAFRKQAQENKLEYCKKYVADHEGKAADKKGSKQLPHRHAYGRVFFFELLVVKLYSLQCVCIQYIRVYSVIIVCIVAQHIDSVDIYCQII